MLIVMLLQVLVYTCTCWKFQLGILIGTCKYYNDLTESFHNKCHNTDRPNYGR